MRGGRGSRVDEYSREGGGGVVWITAGREGRSSVDEHSRGGGGGVWMRGGKEEEE